MFDAKNIYDLMANGSLTAEDLATQFADALNGAIALQKEAEKKAAADTLRAEKAAALVALVNELADFMDKFYHDLDIADALRAFMTAEDAAELVDAFDEAANETRKLMETLDKLPAAAKPRKRALPVDVKVKGADADPLMKFLKDNGLF